MKPVRSPRKQKVVPSPSPARSSSARRPKLYDQKLEYLTGVGEVATDELLNDPVELVKLFKQCPQFSGRLVELTTPGLTRAPGEPENVPPRRKRGRPRHEGNWALLYLAFVLSRDPAMLSFWTRWASSPIWAACGFRQRPSYPTLAERFSELEVEFPDAFLAVARQLVRQAQRHDPQVGRYWHCDATAFQLNAVLHHKCLDPAKCDHLARQQKRRVQQTLALTDDGTVKELRDREQRSEVADEQELIGGALEIEAASIEPAGEGEAIVEDLDPQDQLPIEIKDIGDGIEVVRPPSSDDGGFLVVWIAGHRYVSRDASGGLRLYQTKPDAKGRRRVKAVWFGGLAMLAHDSRTGGVLGALTIPASRNEATEYSRLYEQARWIAGDAPLAMTGDRAYAFASVYEHNTRRQVATVVPFRARKGVAKRIEQRTDLVDEHGVPRCQHCGGPGDQFGAGLGLYQDKNDKWRLRYRCQLGFLAECQQIQSLACEKNWRLLQPLNLTAPIYHDLAAAHHQFERGHHFLRKRYGAVGKEKLTRLNRIGIHTQQARLNAAMVVDWFRINLRQGWLQSAQQIRQNFREPKRLVGSERLAKVLDARRRRQLNDAIGKQRDKLDWTLVKAMLGLTDENGKPIPVLRGDVLKPPEDASGADPPF